MNKKLYLLTDYKNHFELKWRDKPYCSGYNHQLLRKHFHDYGFEIELIQYSDIDFASMSEWKNRIVLYTSSEEIDYNYKDFIEDIIYGLEIVGAHVIPSYRYLRANNNKVFMESLRGILYADHISGISGRGFGTLEELERALDRNEIEFPCVIKAAKGAQSKGVALAKTSGQLIQEAKRLARTPHVLRELKDWGRTYKFPGYKKESRFQKKFIVQRLVPHLQNDWKVLVYADRYYILRRNNRPNDFRASGSGLFSPDKKADFPMHMLDFIEDIFNKTDVPNLSIDFAYDGAKGYILEIQAIHFGKSTIYYCSNYCAKHDGKWDWHIKEEDYDQEKIYAMSIVRYLKNHPEMTTR